MTSVETPNELEAQPLRNVAGLLRKADFKRTTLGGIGLEMPDGSYGVAMDNPFLPSEESTGVIVWFGSRKMYEEACTPGNRIADHMTKRDVFPTLHAATSYLFELASE